MTKNGFMEGKQACWNGPDDSKTVVEEGAMPRKQEPGMISGLVWETVAPEIW